MQSEPEYILVEAVNIDATVFDTVQISVIRGGSYLLARAIRTIAYHPRLGAGLEALSIGGSSGLFLVAGHLAAADRAHHIARYLCSHSLYRLFSFAVEYARAPDPATARVRLSARLRFRQLRQPTQPPDPSADRPFDRACGLHGRRGAHAERTALVGGEPKSLSPSVYLRLGRGRRLRAALNFALLRPADWPSGTPPLGVAELHTRLAEYELSENLEQLSHCDRFRALSGKLAVIHLDGNGFGKLQAANSGSDAAQSRFDRSLRARRARALADVLQGFVPVPGEQPSLEAVISTVEAKGERPVLRLETLLWGGDEMTLVVPAWLGFEVLLQLFASLGRASDGDDDVAAMTHAAGIVFCHAKTPIGRMRELAQQLCESVKARFDPGLGPPDAFDYVVLESIDYPVEKTLDAFFALRYDIKNAKHRTDLAPVLDWRTCLAPALRRLLAGDVLARSQVFRLARRVRFDDHQVLFGHHAEGAVPWSGETAAAAGTAAESLSPFERDELRMIKLAKERAPSGSVAADLATVADFFRANTGDQRTRAWLWLHLAELWDYLVPERDHKVREASR